MNFNFSSDYLKNIFYDKDVIVTVQICYSPLPEPPLVRLNPKDSLSNIRKQLEKDGIINDTLSFSMKNNDNSNSDTKSYEFSKIVREEDFILKDILETIDNNNILYLIYKLPFNFSSDYVEEIKKNFNNVMVTVQIGDSPLRSVKLNLNEKLPNIRKQLEKDGIIDDTLSFSKKILQNNDGDTKSYKFSKIGREGDFVLEEILEKNDNDNYILYLVSEPSWKSLNKLRKLDYGCSMTSDGINIAEKQAFTIKDCEFILIGSEGYKNDTLKFKSKEDWIKKTNLFFNADINVNSVGLGILIERLKSKNFNDEIESTYRYTEIGKVLLKLSKENLEPISEFINVVKNAIKSNNPREEFKKITENYGLFIPTEVILGGRVYFKEDKILSENSEENSRQIAAEGRGGPVNGKVVYNSSDSKINSKFYSFSRMRLLGGKHPNDDNYDEKAWIKSLEDYGNWDRIEFRNPISIFQLLPDNLRKETFESIGKRILHSNIQDHEYYLNKSGKPEIVDLKDIPPNILKILQNGEAKCNIFAAVCDTEESKNDFCNCQILCPPDGMPRVVIHCVQKLRIIPRLKLECKLSKLKISWMVVGYDTDFNYILSDFNIQLKVIEENFNASNRTKLLNFEYNTNSPCIGIPVRSDFSNDSLIIGHQFFNAQKENKIRLCASSYCLKEKSFVDLPNFNIYTLIISNYPNSSSFGMKPLIKYINLEKDPTRSKNPKYISLFFTSEINYSPTFLRQKINQIKIKYLDCNCKKCFYCKDKTLIKVPNGNMRCAFFDPYISDEEQDLLLIGKDFKI